MALSIDVRCSILVIHNHAVLLIHRTHDGLDDWVLPGGTPRDGEGLAECARRELMEETDVAASPSQVAFVVESVPAESGSRVVDLVFIAANPIAGRERRREAGMQPLWVSANELSGLAMHPSLASRLIRWLDQGPPRGADYVINLVH